MTRTSRTTRLETVEPIGKRVLIRKDEDKKITKVGDRKSTRLNSSHSH
jgi:hypothetical protein